ncbi:MAG: hypothetical protein ACLTTO_07780 [Lachnospiraceae bacterium]
MIFQKKQKNFHRTGVLFYTPSGGNAAAGTVFAVSFERQFDLWI